MSEPLPRVSNQTAMGGLPAFPDAGVMSMLVAFELVHQPA
jgi:hypothetical protein